MKVTRSDFLVCQTPIQTLKSMISRAVKVSAVTETTYWVPA